MTVLTGEILIKHFRLFDKRREKIKRWHSII